MVENGAHGFKIVSRAPKMVPSGPKMKPQLSPKSHKYHANTIPTPSGMVAVVGAHATVDIKRNKENKETTHESNNTKTKKVNRLNLKQ